MTGFRTALAIVATAIPSLALAQASPVQPGLWEIAATVDTVDMPSAPPAVAKMMQGKTTTIRHCITPEEASRGPQDILKANKACTFTRYSMAGGRLRFEMVCKQNGGTMSAKTTGAFTPTSFVAKGRSVITGAATMTMTSTSTGRRLGPCK